jgi:hypothetical protein
MVLLAAPAGSRQEPPKESAGEDARRWDRVFGEKAPRYRTEPNALLRTISDWRILHYEDGRFPSDWNPGAPTHVVRLLARKPDRPAGAR